MDYAALSELCFGTATHQVGEVIKDGADGIFIALPFLLQLGLEPAHFVDDGLLALFEGYGVVFDFFASLRVLQKFFLGALTAVAVVWPTEFDLCQEV